MTTTTTTCPAWCVPARHSTHSAGVTHSRPVAAGIATGHGLYGRNHWQVDLASDDQPGGVREPALVEVTIGSETTRLAPAEAREIAGAMLAAADLGGDDQGEGVSQPWW